ncbi:MAG: hypothetical protein ACJAYD_000670 [Patiriisocius sp.]|jgi:hypothetical protein
MKQLLFTLVLFCSTIPFGQGISGTTQQTTGSPYQQVNQKDAQIP